MAKLLIWLNQSPAAGPAARLAFELAQAATAQGHRVSFFLLDDGVYNAVGTGTKAPVDLAGELAAWMAVAPAEREVLACALSSQERGLTAEALWPGVRISHSAALGGLLREADRILAFLA